MPTPNNQSIVETTATSPDVSLRPSRIQLACPEETSAIHHHNSHPATTTTTTTTATTTAPGWQQQDHIEHHLRQGAATVTTTTTAATTTTATTTIAVQSGIEPFLEGDRILENTTLSSALPLPPLLSVDEEKVYTAATTTTTTTIAVAATAAPTIITTTAVASPIRDLPAAAAAGEQRTPVPSTSPSSSPSDKDPRSTPSPTTVATARKIFTQQSTAPAGGNASSNNTSSALDTLSVPPPDHDFSTKRVLPSYSCSFLRPGSKFVGKQTSDRSTYEVHVELKHVNMAESFLCGYLRIKGLTEDHPTLTTYFEGEMIGDKYSFQTRRPEWGSSEKNDFQHWSRFQAFRPLVSKAKRTEFNYTNFAQKENIFMRWKEYFLVPDHRVRQITGASFEGFYYICFNQVSGTVDGIYFHAKSEKFQKLQLKHVPERTFACVEFR